MSTFSSRKKAFQLQPPVPSIHDTHCDGAGLEHSTKPWSTSMKFYYRWLAEDNTDVPLPPQVDLKGKWAIVSGSNSGIGREAAYVLALWGANVVLACRNPPPHEDHPEAVIEDFVSKSQGAIKKSQLEWWEVDYGSFDSVSKFGKRWIESGRTLDLLCNNAGLNINKYVKTGDGYDMVNQVNYMSHVLITYIVLPSMKDAKAPRIVNTSSNFHYGGTLDFANFNSEKDQGEQTIKPYADFYCDSKLKLAMWSRELQSRCSRSEDYKHVLTYALHPGFVASNVWNSGWKAEMAQIKTAAVNLALKKLAINTEQGGRAILYAALLGERGLGKEYIGNKQAIPERYTESIGGRFYMRHLEAPPRPEVFDLTARARLWERTMEDIHAKKYGFEKLLPGPLPGLK